ncbi:MAG: DciA family protein [Pseudomonadota bacterium]
MCALKLISNSTAKVTDKVFQRKFIALGKILTRWEDIMGPKLSKQAQPSKIRYRKPRRKGDKPQAILEISTSSANASLLIMQKGMLIEKINYLFGEDWITDIKFNHLASNESHTVKKQTNPLTEEEKNSLSQLLNDIKDPEIKERLLNMGTSLLEDTKQ